jgi:uncharacterized protein YbjT (DUF2867 family)
VSPDGVTLVVGATGILGGEITRALRAAGRPVRALVRKDGDPVARERLAALGVQLAFGDLKQPGSVEDALAGAAVLISTATAMRSRRAGDAVTTVDQRGQLDLMDAAARAGVGRIVFVSFPPTGLDFPLQRAKTMVEERLRAGRTPYTILQAANFCEVWMGPRLGVDVASRRAIVLGAGDRPVSWIRVRDVARFAVAAAEGGRWSGRTVRLGGPEALTPLQAVGVFESLLGEGLQRDHVPLAALERRLAEAADDVAASSAGIALATARGLVVDPAEALDLLSIPLGTVRDYATEHLRSKTDTHPSQGDRYATKGHEE